MIHRAYSPDQLLSAKVENPGLDVTAEGGLVDAVRALIAEEEAAAFGGYGSGGNGGEDDEGGGYHGGGGG
eukprot:CAMPEP_0197577780 /NCGR_PEP_ID=MMETSP1326-20131121/2283_1 /TAXON_ID=1155430 /ORGANISM="Genus nov. species nov., Strain RCC2288" /LENGTH=69 /DNA_ID=CAMNT_0043140895 /DNA_START=224 /DNA_END=431 /DNA_ORIENTATION=-